MLAEEMRLLFADRVPGTVLEIGCGNGALFGHLGFGAASRYLGVDFSPSMLAAFAARFPGRELVAADGAEFLADDRFDLIFSSHVAQYWDRDQLTGHVANAVSMATDDGLVVIAGIPWSRMRWAFARGDVAGGSLTGSGRRSLPRTAAAYVRERGFPDIGHWYDLDELRSLAVTHHRTASFRASGYYPYRFHAVLAPARTVRS